MQSLHKQALEREMTFSEPLQSLTGHQDPQLPLYDALFLLDDVLSEQMMCLLLGLVKRVARKEKQGRDKPVMNLLVWDFSLPMWPGRVHKW